MSGAELGILVYVGCNVNIGNRAIVQRSRVQNSLFWTRSGPLQCTQWSSLWETLASFCALAASSPSGPIGLFPPSRAAVPRLFFLLFCPIAQTTERYISPQIESFQFYLKPHGPVSQRDQGPLHIRFQKRSGLRKV